MPWRLRLRADGFAAGRPQLPGLPVAAARPARRSCPACPSQLPGLLVQMIDVHRRQLLHLVLGDAEPDTVVDSGHGADRDSYLLAAPQMPLLEQHMGYPVVARIDDEPLDKPDRAVGGVD